MSFSGWREVSLEEISDMKYGKMPKKEDIIEKGYPIFSGYRVTGYHKEYMFDEPQLIVVARGVGGTGDVKLSPPKCYLTNLSIAVMLNEKLASKKYLYYYFQKLNLRNLDTGSAQSQITITDLKRYKVTLPPLIEQKAIADTLSCLDDKIQLNNSINKALEEMAQAIFKSWFVDFEPFQDGEFEDSELGRIPKGWRVGTIDEFAKDMKNGGTPSRKKDNFWNSNDVSWIKTGEIKNSLIIKSEEHISYEGLNNSSAKVLPYNSVLMAMYGATAGQIGLLKFEASTNQACCAMICNSANKAILLYLYLLANQSYIESLAVGAAQQNLSKDTISKLKLVIPKDEVIESVIFDEIFKCIENNLRENQTLETIRDSLLPKLMSGEIRVPLEEVQ
ncbi:MAG: restriction endonuclease subunit S [Thermincolia bacterium]